MNLLSYSMKISMYKIIITAIFLFGTLHMTAQKNSDDREKIRSLKAAYITDQLNLSSEEAQKFWPIYNKYHHQRRDLYKREHAEIENLDQITEEEAQKMLLEYIKMEQEDYVLLRDFYRNLRKIFPAKKIIHLKKVEDDFNHRLLREYRQRNSSNPKPKSE